MGNVIESLYEIYEIVQMKDGCVYKTKPTGRREWYTYAEREALEREGLILCPIVDLNACRVRRDNR